MSERNQLPALSENPYPEDIFFGRFAVFWHIITYSMMALHLGLALYTAAMRNALGAQHALLVLLTLMQAGIYARTFIFTDCWPPQRNRLILSFVVAPALVFIQQAIEPICTNLFWMYLGHVFSLALSLWAGLAVLWVMTFSFYVSLITPQAIMANPFSLLAGFPVALLASTYYFFMCKLTEFGARRKVLIQELQAAYHELDAARAREGELAALKERERIARDMHDNLGHALVALSVQLEATQRLYKKDPDRAAAQMDQMKALTRESMDALRRSLAGLRAPGLGSRPLRQAVQEMCAAMSQRSGVTVTCNIAPQADALSLPVAEAIWSVAQEALTNIEKHARARHADVGVDCDATGVTLRVIDDGIGLPVDALNRAGHFGLRGMQERIEGVGGELKIDENVIGTRMQARIPLI